MRFILFFFYFLTSTYAFAECDFLTADQIDGMANPQSIKLINIEIPKSAKYAKNVFKIFSSRSSNIPEKLKKPFRAKVTVTYDFGTCKYTGKVRQSGDGKDHIKLLDGNPVQSLNVKLKSGNVVGATQFKLLIPETRNGKSEILGSLLLRKLDFIAPETFEVKVSVNGTRSLMLFQEKAVKELLERNFRREGPIFEGDESILWSYQDYSNFELLPLSLSRLVNDNWFNKGATSQKIVISSFNRLQRAYLNYAYSVYLDKITYFFPLNQRDDYSLNDYHILVLAMNGLHGLSPNNRQFYFNAIEDRFEPIYYDGNLGFTGFNLDGVKNYDEFVLVKKTLSQNLKNRLQQTLSSNNLKASFLKRLDSMESAEAFYVNSVNQFVTNISLIEDQQSSSSKIDQDLLKKVNDYSWYLTFQKQKKLIQNIVKRVSLQKDHATLFMTETSKKDISLFDLSKILSRNEINNERFVILPNVDSFDKSKEYKEVYVGGEIIRMSGGITAVIDEKNKKLEFTQTSVSDWVLFLGGDYSHWDIKFNGVFTDMGQFKFEQRFNEFGLTGCLTLYGTRIDNTFIEVRDGRCEDSLNFVLAKGDGVRVSITNSFADAVDADFSKLNVSDLHVENAGNDCFDVSGGTYKITSARLANCNDKALSVGEMSSLEVKTVNIVNAGIGVSAKDSSKVFIEIFNVRGSSLCGEAKRKKQEFGGGYLEINETNCDNIFNNDKESLIMVNSK